MGCRTQICACELELVGHTVAQASGTQTCNATYVALLKRRALHFSATARPPRVHKTRAQRCETGARERGRWGSQRSKKRPNTANGHVVKHAELLSKPHTGSFADCAHASAEPGLRSRERGAQVVRVRARRVAQDIGNLRADASGTRRQRRVRCPVLQPRRAVHGLCEAAERLEDLEAGFNIAARLHSAAQIVACDISARTLQGRTMEAAIQE